MKKIKYILFIIWLIVYAKFASAQSIVSAGGGVKQVGNTTIAYTIGQSTIASGSFSSGNVRIVTGGFEQPEFFSSVEVFEIDGKKVEIVISPNPASDWLRITSEGLTQQGLSVTITDIKGRIVKNQAYDGVETTIDIQSLVQGLYILQLNNAKLEVLKNFKILKQ